MEQVSDSKEQWICWVAVELIGGLETCPFPMPQTIFLELPKMPPLNMQDLKLAGLLVKKIFFPVILIILQFLEFF